jgi:nucleoid DNA-binding protein
LSVLLKLFCLIRAGGVKKYTNKFSKYFKIRIIAVKEDTMSYRTEIARQLSINSSGNILHHRKVLRSTLNILIDALIMDGRIELRGFGVFEINVVKPRKIIHPRTKAVCETKPLVIKFKPSKNMINKLYNHQK